LRGGVAQKLERLRDGLFLLRGRAGGRRRGFSD
jgi:hypothetical protein